MSAEENEAVSQLLTELMRDLNAFPVPTIALVHGACIGGGTGFAASCDIVIASEDAFFAVAEVKWGAHASPIFPQLIAAMGCATAPLCCDGGTFRCAPRTGDRLCS